MLNKHDKFSDVYFCRSIIKLFTRTQGKADIGFRKI